jgi:DNA-directed RNA polymerase specialized sigma subunit
VSTLPSQDKPHLVAYELYKKDPSHDNLYKVVDSLSPAVNGALRSMGGDEDPAMQVKAKVLAAKAIKSYDPKYGASLATWVSQQMQPLRRYRRTQLNPVRVPEGIQLDALHIMQKENEFIEQNNREPDVEELADYSKLPVARIQKVRKSYKPVATQVAYGENLTSSNIEQTDYSDEALHYVYQQADKTDRDIIEMKTGYGGKYQPMVPKQIAQVLNLTPVQLARRSARLAMRVNEARENLTDIIE